MDMMSVLVARALTGLALQGSWSEWRDEISVWKSSSGACYVTGLQADKGRAIGSLRQTEGGASGWWWVEEDSVRIESAWTSGQVRVGFVLQMWIWSSKLVST